MTKNESNGWVSVVSNRPYLDRTGIRHNALRYVANDHVRWHSGAFGVMQGWSDRYGVRLPQNCQDALSELLDAGLITNGQPPTERRGEGNPVRATPIGALQFAVWNSAVARVGAA